MSFFYIFVILGAVTVIATLFSLRREHIRTEYSLSWLLVGFVLAILALVPVLVPSLTSVTERLGIDSHLFLPIAGGILISMLVFEISHVVSRLRDENVMLAQRLAILEFQLHQIEQRHDSGGK